MGGIGCGKEKCCDRGWTEGTTHGGRGVQTFDAEAPLSGTITHSAYLGDHVEYEVRTEAGTFFVVDPAVERSLETSSSVAVGFRDRGIALISD